MDETIEYEFSPPELSLVETIRHSAAHLMASAVAELFPGTRFGTGPHIKHGFYYDMELPRPITNDDLPVIEARMRQIAKKNLRFEASVKTRDEATAWAKETDQPYKVELIDKHDVAEYGF